MIIALSRALAENHLGGKLKRFSVPRPLIDRSVADLFFRLIGRRYDKGPMILTSNQSFDSSVEALGDRVIATWSSLGTPVLHHAITINICGNSHRLKDKLKGGLVRAKQLEAIN